VNFATISVIATEVGVVSTSALSSVHLTGVAGINDHAGYPMYQIGSLIFELVVRESKLIATGIAHLRDPR
jgi:hypothetical protein